MKRTKCAVVHSNHLKRKGFELFFFGSPHFNLIAAVNSIEDILSGPCLDASMVIIEHRKDDDFIASTKRLQTAYPALKLIVDVNCVGFQDIQSVLHYPFRGLICLEASSPNKIRSVLLRALNDGGDFSIAKELYPQLSGEIDEYNRSLPRFTSFQMKILCAYFNNRSVSKTAHMLGYHRNSISRQLHSMAADINAKDPIDLLIGASARGWLE